MRTTFTVLALLLSLQCGVMAQDEAPKVKEVDTNALLTSALAGDKAARTELLKLSVEEIQSAIKGYEFKEAKKSGIVQLKTKCPDGHARPYWVRIPKGYDPAKSYPAIVGLHGGVNGAPLYGNEENTAPGKGSIGFWESNLGDQVDEVFLIGCSASPRETNKNAVWWKREGQRNILHFLFETKCQFNIDDDRVFLTGHSDGGSGSFAMAAHMPNAFAGYFPMNGHPLVQAMDGEGFWIENLKGKKIYAFNSGKDGLYPAAQMTPIYDQANAAGADVKYSVHSENDHGIRNVVGKEIPKFMKEYAAKWTRNSTPDEVDWTCDSTDCGRCGWLEIKEIAELVEDRAEANRDITLGPGRVRLGIMVKRDVDQPTVDSVVPKSTAEQMGLKVDDQIIELDGKKITVMKELADALSKCKAGDKVKIKVTREGAEKELEGEFAAAEENKFTVSQEAARVVASNNGEGLFSLKLRRVGKFSIHLTPEMMVDGNRFLVSFSGGIAGVSGKSFAGIEPDKAYILDQFLKTADRKSTFIAKVDLDVGKMRKEAKKDSPPAEDEDEF
ncbi:PDZ domain-containing protein [Planctomycetota bacterium]|nr:PDZ domain-containing protein [Planctomycetota bacterium]